MSQAEQANNSLPPDEVLDGGGIARADVETLPWHDPIWRCSVDGVTFSLTSRNYHNAASLDWESDLLDELERLEIPASRPVRIFDGRDHIKVGDHHYVARRWIEGTMLSEYRSPDLFEVGRFIGGFHQAVESAHITQRPGITGSLADFLSPPDDGLRKVLPDEDARRFREFVDQVRPFVVDHGLPTIAVHGDFTTRNIVLGDDGTWSLIDFGMAHVASPSVELAYAIGSARRDWDAVDYLPDQVRSLIGGYVDARGKQSFDPDVVVAYASARPLLHISMLAHRGGGRAITTGSMGRAAWLSEHADELRSYITTSLP